MGANAQTSVPTFTAGEVLTAANMNISARTGIPVFADATARNAAFGGTGEKTLAEGQFAYLEDSNATQYYDGSAWQSVGVAPGLVLVATATASAVASISINNCFTSTYANYKIIANITASVGANATFSCRFRVGGVDTSANYKQGVITQYSTTVAGALNPAGTDELEVGLLDATGKNFFNTMEIQNPEAAQQTTGKIFSNGQTSTTLFNYFYGFTQSDSTQFDGITFLTSGTSFTGVIRVYGFANS
jgi:hypothetical protein